MKYDKLLTFVGKKVEIKFFDNDVRKGTLELGKGMGNDFVDDNPKWFRIQEERINEGD